VVPPPLKPAPWLADWRREGAPTYRETLTTMVNDAIRVAFDATLDEFVDVHMRQVRLALGWIPLRLYPMMAGGAGVTVLTVILVYREFGPLSGTEMLLTVALGVLVGGCCGLLYLRHLAWRVQQALLRQYGDRFPMRCEIELRPTCLWVRQDGVEMALDWATAEAVNDTPDGVELWFRWGLVVARDRGFATSSHREWFVGQARALSSKR
jgi:hypothetical protein